MLVGAAEGWVWRDRILAEYERLAGAPIQELAWFEAAACGKRLFSVVASLIAGPEALGMRPEAVEMMRKSSSVRYATCMRCCRPAPGCACQMSSGC